MKTTEEMLKNLHEYAQWLGNRLDELHISQNTLAEGIGRTQRTVSRYVNAVNLPDEQTQKQIEDFLENVGCRYNGYRHIPSEEFAELLARLMDEFDITQKLLAKKIGKYQKDISNYLNNTVSTDPKTQHDILHYFFTLCFNGSDISMHHLGTAYRLERMLYEDEESYRLPDFLDLDFGEMGGLSPAGEFIISLPKAAALLVLDNLSIFCDTYLDLVTDSFGNSFEMLRDTMELYKDLTPKNKKKVQSILEDECVGYPRTVFERQCYDHLTLYRKMVTTDIDKLMQDEARLTSAKERFSCSQIIERELDNQLVGDSGAIEEIAYKLGMSSHEWYIWMLMINYEIKHRSVYSLCCSFE